MTVTVKKIGGSFGVVIPKSAAQELELTEGMSLDISTNADSLIMRKQGRRPRRPLARIVQQMKLASYKRRSREMLDDDSIGKEIG